MNEIIGRLIEALAFCIGGHPMCQGMTPNPNASAAAYQSQIVYARDAYDPQAYAFDDLQRARLMADFYERRILLVVGGDWCAWCYILEDFLADDDEARAEFAESFVIMKVHYSTDEPNEEFLSAYPEIPGYPHFFVFDADGRVLHSQDTLELEDGGDSYDPAAMAAFAREWRAPAEP